MTNLKEILTEIENGLEYLNSSIKKNVYTIIVGPTGAGKSTLANVLTERTLVIREVEGKKVYDVDGSSTIKIGHKNVSATKRPNIENSYIDCPGLGDTDPAKELKNAVYMQKVFSCEKIKVIIVVESSSIFHGRAQLFINMLKALNDCMGEKFEYFSKQFGLCISKVSLNDFAPGAMDNPNSISDLVQNELKSSTYQDGIKLVRSLEDRIMCFMNNDLHESIKKKLMILLPKINAGDAIPISPIISHAGTSIINEMIKGVFKEMNDYNSKSVAKYITKTFKNLKTSNDFNMTDYMNKINNHVASRRTELFNTGISNIENSNGMNNLVENLNMFSNSVKEVLSISADHLKPILFMASIYPDSNTFANTYKFEIIETIRPVMKLEEKYDRLVKDISTLEKNWSKIKELTTGNKWTKLIAIGVGVASASVLAVDSMQTLEVSMSKAAKLTASIVTGCSFIFGGHDIWTSKNEVVESCNTFENNHPQVKPYADEFKQIYRALPSTFAKLWIDSRPIDNSGYLQTLKQELKLTHTDNFSSQYNDII